MSMRITRFQLNPRGEINLDLCLRKTRADKSPDYREVIVFKMFTLKLKVPFLRLFSIAPFSVDNFSGLVWTEGLAGEIKLRFQIPPA